MNLHMFIERVFVGQFFLFSAWLSGQTGSKFRFFFGKGKTMVLKLGFDDNKPRIIVQM